MGEICEVSNFYLVCVEKVIFAICRILLVIIAVVRWLVRVDREWILAGRRRRRSILGIHDISRGRSRNGRCQAALQVSKASLCRSQARDKCVPSSLVNSVWSCRISISRQVYVWAEGVCRRLNDSSVSIFVERHAVTFTDEQRASDSASEHRERREPAHGLPLLTLSVKSKMDVRRDRVSSGYDDEREGRFGLIGLDEEGWALSKARDVERWCARVQIGARNFPNGGHVARLRIVDRQAGDSTRLGCDGDEPHPSKSIVRVERQTDGTCHRLQERDVGIEVDMDVDGASVVGNHDGGSGVADTDRFGWRSGANTALTSQIAGAIVVDDATGSDGFSVAGNRG